VRSTSRQREWDYGRVSSQLQRWPMTNGTTEAPDRLGLDVTIDRDMIETDSSVVSGRARSREAANASRLARALACCRTQ